MKEDKNNLYPLSECPIPNKCLAKSWRVLSYQRGLKLAHAPFCFKEELLIFHIATGDQGGGGQTGVEAKGWEGDSVAPDLG